MHSSDLSLQKARLQDRSLFCLLSEYSGYSYLSVIFLPKKATDGPKHQFLLINHPCVALEQSSPCVLNKTFKLKQDIGFEVLLFTPVLSLNRAIGVQLGLSSC